MAPRKKIASHTKSLSIQNSSNHSKSRSQTRGKSKNTINSGDLTVNLKLSIFVLMVLALGGLLLNPYIFNLMNALREDSTGNVRISEKTQTLQVEDPSVNKERSSKVEEEHIQAPLDSTRAKLDDVEKDHLMENDELHKNTEHEKYLDTQNKADKENTATRQNRNEHSNIQNKAGKENTATKQNKEKTYDTENKAVKDNKATRQNENESPDTQSKAANKYAATRTRQTINGNLPLEEEQNKGTATANEKSSSTDANKQKEGRCQSQNEIADQKRVPILLNAKNNQIVLDQSQITIVDSSQDKTVKPKNDKGKQAEGSTEYQNAENKNKKHNTEAKAEITNKDENKHSDLREEAKNFNATYQKTFTPKKIFADGRRIPPIELLHRKTSNSSVRVFLFDDFLSQQECDGLIQAHDNHVKALNKPPILCFDSVTTLRKHIKDAKKSINVSPRDFTKGTKCVNASFSLQLQNWMQSNWSYSTAFYPGESPFSKIIAHRIKDAMGLDPASGGKFQITSYPEGKAYKEHTDCTLGGKDSRDRVVSVMIYLSNVEEGGETTFQDLGIWVKPRKGRALVWNNMSPDGVCEGHSKHRASVVRKGSKYILIRWYYYKTFYSLGRRPPIPHLPEREPEQPVVLCDEYTSGSCRWYDEWTYQHMIDYQQNKFQLF